MGRPPRAARLPIIRRLTRAFGRPIVRRSRGMTEMGCDSIESLREAFPELQAMLEDHDTFRDYYSFCFGFAKEPVQGARTLPTEVA